MFLHHSPDKKALFTIVDNPVNPVDKWFERQGHGSPEFDLSIVIPAFNEALRLPTTLIDTIDFLDTRGDSYEIIVVDDGSSDATSAGVKKFEKFRKQVRLITLPANSGKGAAVRMGVLNARGQKVLFCDADGATPIGELERLEAALLNGAKVAFGSRAIRSQETKVEARTHRRIIGRIFNCVVSTLLLPKVADTQCGFKLFTSEAARELFRRQTLSGFGFDVEILFLARQLGLQSIEVPVNWTNIPGSKVNLVMDSVRMFIEVILVFLRHRSIVASSGETGGF